MKRPKADEQPGPKKRFSFLTSQVWYWAWLSHLTSIRTKDNVVLVWIPPALEEIEEQMMGPYVYVTRVRTSESV